jgi:LysM repeat protein
MDEEGDNMTNPDDKTDIDFVWHSNYSEEDQIDNYEHVTNEPSYDPQRKWFSIPMVAGAVGFSILAVLLIVVLSRSQNYAGKKQVWALEKRLDGLEAEFISLKTYIASKLDQAIKEIEQDRYTTATKNATPAKTPPSAQKELKDDKPKVQPKVHIVLAGESLSRISRYYGLTIEQLREYNNLDLNATIHPGQRLELSP